MRQPSPKPVFEVVLLFLAVAVLSSGTAFAQKRRAQVVLDPTGTWTSKIGTLSLVRAGDSLSFSYSAVFGATAHTCDGIGVATYVGEEGRFEWSDASGMIAFVVKKGEVWMEPGPGVVSFCGANWPGDSFNLDGYHAPMTCTVTEEKAFFHAVGAIPPEPRKGFVMKGDKLDVMPLQNDAPPGWVLARFKGKNATTAGLIAKDAIQCPPK